MHHCLSATVHDRAPVPGDGIGSDQAAHTQLRVTYCIQSFRKRPRLHCIGACLAAKFPNLPDHARSSPEIHHVSRAEQPPLGGLAAPLRVCGVPLEVPRARTTSQEHAQLLPPSLPSLVPRAVLLRHRSRVWEVSLQASLHQVPCSTRIAQNRLVFRPAQQFASGSEHVGLLPSDDRPQPPRAGCVQANGYLAVDKLTPYASRRWWWSCSACMGHRCPTA